VYNRCIVLLNKEVGCRWLHYNNAVCVSLIHTFSSIYLLVMLFYRLLFLFRVYPFSLLLQYQEMNFFKKISSKRISTAPDERNKSKFKFKNKPLPPSPPLSKDDSLLELNIPDDFSSFDIPQLQSIHKQSVASIEDDQPTHTVINITTENTTTTAISLLESFSKTEAEQGTRMHAEVDNSTASSTISENHSELALEFTEK
jgi:hypothetical protein